MTPSNEAPMSTQEVEPKASEESILLYRSSSSSRRRSSSSTTTTTATTTAATATGCCCRRNSNCSGRGHSAIQVMALVIVVMKKPRSCLEGAKFKIPSQGA